MANGGGQQYPGPGYGSHARKQAAPHPSQQAFTRQQSHGQAAPLSGHRPGPAYTQGSPPQDVQPPQLNAYNGSTATNAYASGNSYHAAQPEANAAHQRHSNNNNNNNTTTAGASSNGGGSQTYQAPHGGQTGSNGNGRNPGPAREKNGRRPPPRENPMAASRDVFGSSIEPRDDSRPPPQQNQQQQQQQRPPPPPAQPGYAQHQQGYQAPQHGPAANHQPRPAQASQPSPPPQPPQQPQQPTPQLPQQQQQHAYQPRSPPEPAEPQQAHAAQPPPQQAQQLLHHAHGLFQYPEAVPHPQFPPPGHPAYSAPPPYGYPYPLAQPALPLQMPAYPNEPAYAPQPSAPPPPPSHHHEAQPTPPLQPAQPLQQQPQQPQHYAGPYLQQQQQQQHQQQQQQPQHQQQQQPVPPQPHQPQPQPHHTPPTPPSAYNSSSHNPPPQQQHPQPKHQPRQKQAQQHHHHHQHQNSKQGSPSAQGGVPPDAGADAKSNTSASAAATPAASPTAAEVMQQKNCELFFEEAAARRTVCSAEDDIRAMLRRLSTELRPIPRPPTPEPPPPPETTDCGTMTDEEEVILPELVVSQLSVSQHVPEVPPRPEHPPYLNLVAEDRKQDVDYTVCLDIDGTMLTTLYDDAKDVTSVNTRSGLREMLERMLAAGPKLEVGIITAAERLYAKGSRSLMNDLVCGFDEHIFDFCICHDPENGSHTAEKKDLRLVGRDLDKVLLIDNDESVLLQKENSLLVPDFDFDPRARDAVLIHVADLVLDLSTSNMTTPAFLKHCCDNDKYIINHGGFYRMKRYCGNCSATEDPAHPFFVDEQFGSWELLCYRCYQDKVHEEAAALARERELEAEKLAADKKKQSAGSGKKKESLPDGSRAPGDEAGGKKAKVKKAPAADAPQQQQQPPKHAPSDEASKQQAALPQTKPAEGAAAGGKPVGPGAAVKQDPVEPPAKQRAACNGAKAEPAGTAAPPAANGGDKPADKPAAAAAAAAGKKAKQQQPPPQAQQPQAPPAAKEAPKPNGKAQAPPAAAKPATKPAAAPPAKQPEPAAAPKAGPAKPTPPQPPLPQPQENASPARKAAEADKKPQKPESNGVKAALNESEWPALGKALKTAPESKDAKDKKKSKGKK
ncbi:hypothetical protein DIPPA_08133 [Diplonema papillatum]|nr:hypothetical protein DIPPA_08133 [Diplonema papillatum]